MISIAKTVSKKIGAFMCSMKFLFSEVALYLYNQPFGLTWSIVVISGLVLPAATCNCYINCRNGYVGLLVHHLLPWLIVKM